MGKELGTRMMIPITVKHLYLHNNNSQVILEEIEPRRSMMFQVEC